MSVGTVALADVHAAYAAWLHLPSPEVVDVALATIIANRLDGDPVWVFLVAPPSSAKTEIIRSLSDVPEVYPLSSLTPSTFASGFEKKGAEVSLLPRLDGKILTLKDFGTVLTMHRETRAEILAQLREIYDGAFKKQFGNGKVVDWTGKVGLLAGCTPIIDRERALNAALGERFLTYRIPPAPGRDVGRRAALQAGWEGDRRKQLRETVAGFLAELVPLPPPTPEPIIDRLVALAELTARARSPVYFDERTKEIDYIPEPEGPGRLAKQLYLMVRALAIVRAHLEVMSADYVTVFRLAQASFPPQRRVMLEVLLTGAFPGQTFETTEIAEATGYPTSTARRYLSELVALDLATRHSRGQGRADAWAPSQRLLELLEAASIPTGEAENLTTFVGESVVSE